MELLHCTQHSFQNDCLLKDIRKVIYLVFIRIRATNLHPPPTD